MRGWFARVVTVALRGGVATNAAVSYAMPTNGATCGKWHLRGAYDDVTIADFGDWKFPVGTGETSKVWAFVWGRVRPALRDAAHEIRAVDAPMSAIPSVSRLWTAATAEGGRLVTWERFALGRIFRGSPLTGERTVNAQFELRPNGDFVTRSNAVECAYRRIDPFDWDGDGIPNEDDARPRRNDGDHSGQTDECREWVAVQVGAGERNGLYRLRATFPSAPVRRTLLTVGTNRVVVAEAGDYDFLLEKGAEYSLLTEPFDSSITWSADDGVTRRTFRAAAQTAASSAVGRWTEDFGRLVVIPQSASVAGLVFWLPGLKGTPDAGHVSRFPGKLSFAATFTDCRADPAATYRWRTDDPDVRILSPAAKVTEVEFLSAPSWRSSEISVTATIGTNELVSVLRFTYGTNETPQARLSLSLPPGLVRRDLWMEGSRPAPLVVRLDADCPTGGVVRVWQTSGADAVEFSRPLPAEFAVEDAAEWSETIGVSGVAASAAEGDVAFVCSFTPNVATGAVLCAEAEGTVYAPGAVAVPEAPATGLAVVRGTSVGVRLGMEPSAGRGVSVEWQTARRRTRDGYDPWRLRLSGGTSEDLPMDAAGVFALRARTVCATQSNEVEYVHGVSELSGPCKKGMRNHIGVSTSSAMLALRNAALAQMGNERYGRDRSLSARNGFATVQKGKWKCNAFVADLAISVGLPVPIQHTTGNFWLFERHYPPIANEWASAGVEIEGWTYWDTYPVPGFVVAHPNPGSLGHVGVVDYDGEGIGAGKIRVSRNYALFLDGTCGYREYSGGQNDETE